MIELLIVIGLIAVIASFLIPSITKAKDQAASAACASNLHQIGAAFLMYAQDNENKLPFHADWVAPHPEDWLHWWPGPGRDPNDLTKTSAIAKYLGKFTANVFHCPSDDVTSRTRYDTSGKGPRRYEFSYSFNGWFASNFGPPGPRMTAVVNPAGKFMVVEEDELSLDDGHYWPAAFGQDLENFLGSRHSRPRLRNYKSWLGLDAAKRPDRNERGNVVFADGHVDFVTRAFMWLPTSYDPRK